MWKPVIGATAALLIAGSSLVYAQQRFGGPGGPGGPGGGFERGWRRPSPDDMAALADARIAALKAGLRLTPDQDKNWPPFEQALHDLAKLRADRAAAFRQQREERNEGGDRDGGDGNRAVNPFERLQRRADSMTRFSTALKRMADTGAPLYQSLDDAQKHRFMMLARLLRPHPMMSGEMRGGRGGEFQRGGAFQRRGEDQDGRFNRGREDERRGRDDGRRGMDRGSDEL